ncbi:MAG: aminopeptidase P family protein [Desulfobacteraceae bacterium]|jgi:Xaa-Pro aminopeptidase|nr:aminopeptidase P family protein [Desulfobacteraceae bacterium]
MRYFPVNSQLFIDNRDRLKKYLNPNSVAVFNSNDVLPTSADGIHPFKQNPDLFYLTGIDQQETILLICPDAVLEKHREILFIRYTNEEIAIWEGQQLSKENATEVSGIRTVFWTTEFERIFKELVSENRNIYLNSNEHLRADTTVETRDARFLKWCKNAFPLHQYERIAPIMCRLRTVKSAEEIQQIRHACDITNKAFRRILGIIRPGIWEFEIEAEIVYEFLKNRSRGSAYEPIIASGAGSCVLHYTANDRQCADGDLLLMDFGAEYANYAADVTRTVPINGRFSERQKDVYNAVLRVQKAAIDLLRPGNTIETYNKEVGRIMEAELIALNLLDANEVKNQDRETPLYRKYFMHGTSHHLGLDVHDVGSRHLAFEAGMVFTCEPGIYVRDEEIGIRIENDILITKDGPVDLTKDIPNEADEIESLMNPR